VRALVTGANRGLGEVVATRLVRDGANALLLDVDPHVRATAERLATLRTGAVVEGVVGDVADEETCEHLFETVKVVLGGIDVLVNIAGIGGPADSATEVSVADFRRVLDVNLVGTFLTSRAAARMMIEQGTGGCIINTSSIFAQQGFAYASPYCASKAGVALLTQSMALELAPYDIRVNAIAPGNMATEMHSRRRHGDHVRRASRACSKVGPARTPRYRRRHRWLCGVARVRGQLLRNRTDDWSQRWRLLLLVPLRKAVH
jgi:NAD(P)-dependent dehydrogenase (short-subunit alcohol dehydrogenase family)